MKSANLAVRFLLELCVLAAIAYWAFHELDGAPRYVLGIGGPMVVSIVWAGVYARTTSAKSRSMILLLVLLAALVVLGIVLAVVVVKWLFILAVVAALIWAIAFFARRLA